MHKAEASADLRVRRTRKLLQQAFIAGTIEKGFINLTVRDITARAMVNRATFYRHYLDKYDLLEQYANEVFALVEDQPGQAKPRPDKARANLIELLKHIQQFADFYRVMRGALADPLFDQRFRQKAEQRFLAWLNQAFSERTTGADAASRDLQNHTVAAAGCGALVWWLDHDQSYSPEQLANWLSQFIYDISAASLKLRG